MTSGAAYLGDPIRVASADGLWLTAEDGKRYIDACAGTFNVGPGYKHPIVIEAVQAAISSGLLHGSGILRPAIIDRAEAELASIAPSPIDRCHLKGSTGGSTAVEQAVRHAWAVTGRSGIIAFQDGHHGQTIFASLASGMEFRSSRIRGVTADIIRVPPPDCYQCPFKKDPETCKMECAAAIADAIDERTAGRDHNIAAMVAEPILGAGGGVIPPNGYWEIVSEILRKKEILLIADEVQTFGRVGCFFASSYFNSQPDIIAVAKSISGIGVPGSGAVLLQTKHCILTESERSLTWGGSHLVAAAIVATLSVMSSHGFFDRTREVAAKLAESLERICRTHEMVGLVRACGLMAGIEIVASKQTRETAARRAKMLVDQCRATGLLLRQNDYGFGGFIEIRPAFSLRY